MSTLRARSTLALAMGVVAACAACDRIPGLGKKDADGGTTSAGGSGGVLSLLGGSFEGEITMSTTGRAGSGGPTTMVFGIKSPKVRIDASGGVSDNPMLAQGASVIVDAPTKKAYALVPAAKQAIVIDFEKAKALGARPAAGAPSDAPKIDKTGKKEVVAGYECEVWKVSSKSGRADMCVAEGIKWIDLADLAMASPELGVAAAAGEANHFPLRLVSFDANNVQTAQMEATKIEKKKLDDARFVVPADYAVVDMSALMGGGFAVPSGGKLPSGFPPPRRAR